MRLSAAIACMVAMATSGVQAQQGRATEAQIKSAYLYSFGKFVEWPSSAAGQASSSFSICVLGRDPFGKTLDDVLKSASVNGQPVAARRLSAIDEVAGCRIVYIGTSEAARLDAILAALARSAVLTVSDLPNFTDRGGMIRFVEDAKRVRFEISLPPAQAAGLVLRSDLLRVATAVRK
jgi:hypothetical protein